MIRQPDRATKHSHTKNGARDYSGYIPKLFTKGTLCTIIGTVCAKNSEAQTVPNIIPLYSLFCYTNLNRLDWSNVAAMAISRVNRRRCLLSGVGPIALPSLLSTLLRPHTASTPPPSLPICMYPFLRQFHYMPVIGRISEPAVRIVCFVARICQ